MFTGLVEEVGTVRSFAGRSLRISCRKVLEGARLGDSIACNGACLSITAMEADWAEFHVSPTTAEHTRFRPGIIRVGEEINLERALRFSDRLGGHLVTGHVDGEAKIIDITRQGEDYVFEFLYPSSLRPLIVRKGSVTLDGISLTVAEVRSSSFTVAVIPQTFDVTNLRRRRAGDRIHLEADIFGRYVHHILVQAGLRAEDLGFSARLGAFSASGRDHGGY